jgi:predicted Zn-dependent protease with MMP-like domain
MASSNPEFPLTTPAERMEAAEAWIDAVKKDLPPPLAGPANRIPLLLRERSEGEEDSDEDDLLGLFLGDPADSNSAAFPQAGGILIFTETLWDYAEGDPEIFAEEVIQTYLHELGHAIGWDEDDLVDRGLG